MLDSKGSAVHYLTSAEWSTLRTLRCVFTKWRNPAVWGHMSKSVVDYSLVKCMPVRYHFCLFFFLWPASSDPKAKKSTQNFSMIVPRLGCVNCSSFGSLKFKSERNRIKENMFFALLSLCKTFFFFCSLVIKMFRNTEIWFHTPEHAADLESTLFSAAASFTSVLAHVKHALKSIAINRVLRHIWALFWARGWFSRLPKLDWHADICMWCFGSKQRTGYKQFYKHWWMASHASPEARALWASLNSTSEVLHHLLNYDLHTDIFSLFGLFCHISSTGAPK